MKPECKSSNPGLLNFNGRLLVRGAACALLLLSAGAASAASLLDDNFDSYADQAAFVAAWPIVTGTGGTLSGSQSVSSPNSINFPTTAQRNGRTIAETGNPDSLLNLITFSFDFYDSNNAAAPYRQYANLQDGAVTGSGQLVSMGLNNNLTSAADGGNYYMARILGIDGGTGASAYFKLNDAGAPLRATGWHNLRVDISNIDFRFYVDGILSQTIANSVNLRSYDHVRLGSGVSSLNEAFFDNFSVSVIAVPEPGAFAFAALGLGALIFVRKFRR